jgi:hypothetical protein
MLPDPRWLDALKLPDKVIAGLLLFSALVLAFDYFDLFSLADLHALARPTAIIAVLLFGSLSVAAVGSAIYAIIARRHKATLLSARRELRRVEEKDIRAEQEARVLKRLDYLSQAEIRYVADCLRKNEQSFLAWFHSPPVSNLMAKELVSTPGGTHNQPRRRTPRRNCPSPIQPSSAISPLACGGNTPSGAVVCSR